MRMSRQFDENIEAIDPLETIFYNCNIAVTTEKYGHFFSGRYFKKYGRFKA